MSPDTKEVEDIIYPNAGDRVRFVWNNRTYLNPMMSEDGESMTVVTIFTMYIPKENYPFAIIILPPSSEN